MTWLCLLQQHVLIDACPTMLFVCCACSGAGGLLSSRVFARPAVSPGLKAMVTAQLPMNVVSGQPESITQPCSTHAFRLAKGIVRGGQHALQPPYPAVRVCAKAVCHLQCMTIPCN